MNDKIQKYQGKKSLLISMPRNASIRVIVYSETRMYLCLMLLEIGFSRMPLHRKKLLF